MLPYTGSGDYCFSNSLPMSLLGSGAPPESLPSPSFLECLTLMPFGYTYRKEAEIFFFSGPNPEPGLTRAIETLGWTCRVERGGDAPDALARLRTASRQGPVLIGPVNMGCLTYNPNHAYLDGADHYVVVLGVEEDDVVVHDPKGFPSSNLPLKNLLDAWRAERISYRAQPYTQRAAFHPIEAVTREAMIARTLPNLRKNLCEDLWEPGVFGGVAALRRLAQTLRGDVPERLATHLIYFALPLGLRHKVDAQAFLREANQVEAADLIDRQARLLGRAQYAGVQRAWPSVAPLIERVAALEERLIDACADW